MHTFLHTAKYMSHDASLLFMASLFMMPDGLQFATECGACIYDSKKFKVSASFVNKCNQPVPKAFVSSSQKHGATAQLGVMLFT